MSYKIGIDAGLEAILKKQPMNQLLNAAVQVGTTPTGAGMLAGLCESMAGVFDALQKLGHSFKLQTPVGQQIADASPRARRLYIAALSQRIDQASADVLADLSSAVYSVKDCIVSATNTPAEPTPAARIEIVAMPERMTETEIVRDSKDNIVQSVQTERDKG